MIPESYAPETFRISRLPRSPDTADPLNLERPGSPHQLREVQTIALRRIEEADGGIVALGVGHGKFLISVLAPVVLRSQKTVLLVPAALVAQTEREIEKWREFFPIPPAESLRVLSYGALSTLAGKEILTEEAPDLIVADECHHLRRYESARTKRVIRYFLANPSCRFVGLSGTISARNLGDMDHLCEIALREQSPVPRAFREFEAWARCVDVGGDPSPADRRIFEPIKQWAATPTAREAFRARFQSAPGISSTVGSAYDGSIEIHAHKIQIAPRIAEYLRDLDRFWRSPSGDDLISALDVARVRRQLLAGYFLFWDWPIAPDLEWLKARSVWSIAARRWLSSNRRGHDSPLQIKIAAEEGDAPRWVLDAWDQWEPLKDRPAPPVRAQLVDGTPAKCAAEIADDPALIWTEAPAVLAMFDGMGIPSYGAGEGIPEQEDRTIAVSRRAHGTGQNLQRYCNNVALSFPPNGAAVEQMIGRTHRPGQEGDAVIFRLLVPVNPRGTPDPLFVSTMHKIKQDAIYQTEVLGQSSKILVSNFVGF